MGSSSVTTSTGFQNADDRSPLAERDDNPPPPILPSPARPHSARSCCMCVTVVDGRAEGGGGRRQERGRKGKGRGGRRRVTSLRCAAVAHSSLLPSDWQLAALVWVAVL